MTNISATYEKFTKASMTALVLKDEREAVIRGLVDEIELEPLGHPGRGTVYRFRLKNGTAILRPYRRGGFIRHFIKDSYLLDNRPRRELEVTRYLYEQGFPAPEPVGVRWEKNGLFYRGAIATRELHAVNLLEFLRQDPREEVEVMKRVGAVMRHMHDLGVSHPDLQVQNVLVGEDKVYIIDFDNARRSRRVPDERRAENFSRFFRSVLKHELNPGLLRPMVSAYGELLASARLSAFIDGAEGAYVRRHR